MKLYLLKIGSNNDYSEIMNKEMSEKIKNSGAYIFMADFNEIDTTLMSLAFENENAREEFSNGIPQIAFTFETIDYPDDLWARIKDVEKSTGLPNSYCENLIEKALNKLNIRYIKEKQTSSKYCFNIKGKECIIVLGLDDSFVTAAFENGSMYMCYDKRIVKKRIKDILKDIKKRIKNKEV